jgi:hypothetical protein
MTLHEFACSHGIYERSRVPGSTRSDFPCMRSRSLHIAQNVHIPVPMTLRPLVQLNCLYQLPSLARDYCLNTEKRLFSERTAFPTCKARLFRKIAGSN